MNLASTLSLFGGGPGSGCHGDDCGRPPGPGGPPIKPFLHDLFPKPKKDWGSSKFSEKKVGGHFKAGSAIAQIYQKLTDNEGQWHKKSDFRTQFPDIKNLDYRVQILKRRGKLTGKWSVEVSGDQIRLILTRQAQKTEAQVKQDEHDQSLAKKLAQDYVYMQKHEGNVSSAKSKALFADYIQNVGASPESWKTWNKAVDDWSSSVNAPMAQQWRAVAMKYYGRSPDDEHTGSYSGYSNVFKGGDFTTADKMRDAALAMKDYAGEYAKAAGVNVVYRGIGGTAGAQIRQAIKEGADHIEVPMNSLSSWSSSYEKAKSFSGGWGSGVVLKMKIDPDNVWAVHAATPWLFSWNTEKEYVVGARKAREVFNKKDIDLI